MIFYLASETSLPRIRIDPESLSFNTRDLNESEEYVKTHFSLRNILYVGSDQGCRCGFRHALIENDDWLIVSETDESCQINHADLFEFIKNNVQQGFVEIYGCWDGDLSEAPKIKDEIDLSDLQDENFYFKERGLYRIRV